MKHFTIGRIGLALLATAVVSLSQTAVASAQGNSGNAKLCHKGGWRSLTRSDGSSFANQGACVSYAAHGGTLVKKRQSQIDCQAFGGTYSTPGLPLLWTCAGWTANDQTDFNTKASTLANDCAAEGGDRAVSEEPPTFPSTDTFSTCEFVL